MPSLESDSHGSPVLCESVLLHEDQHLRLECACGPAVAFVVMLVLTRRGSGGAGESSSSGKLPVDTDAADAGPWVTF